MGLGRILIILGIVLLAAGLVLHYTNFFSWLHFGRLPGDIRIRRENFSLFIPLTTCIVLSILLSLIVYLLRK
ncbi:MAG TPA: DUF2905 domain-containing protein [Acidobacteriota bacterium]|nr:DUF2905 domain-containing protein [Acidobacteriota bacterium]